MQIIACTTRTEIEATYPAIAELYELDCEKFVTYALEMMEGEFSLFGAFEGEECVGAIGYRIGRRLYCGKYLHIDNLVVRAAHRKKGHAEKMINFCREEAKKFECDVMLADSYVNNSRAQKLFFKQGFYIRGFHLRCDKL